MNEFLLRNKPKIPIILITLLSSFTLFYTLKSIVRVVNVIATRLISSDIQILPIIFGESNRIGYIEFVLVGAISIGTFLLSTRVSYFSKKYMKVCMFSIPFFYVLFSLVGIGITKIHDYVFPFFEEKMRLVLKEQSTINKLLFEEFEGFYTLITLFPVIIILFISMFLFQKFLAHQDLFVEAFYEFELKGERFRKFSNLESKSLAPDVLLGVNVVTKEQVVLPGGDRPLHTLIVGPVGAGKSAAIALVTINQDLNYITQYVNRFKNLVAVENYKDKGLLKNEISGISIIEPSNDLCMKVYQLCKAHNIPEDMIYYIDPTNPKTKSLNIMKGSAAKVAEELTQVLADLSDNGGQGNQFFLQAQRSHLKNYIYLLKLHDKDKLDTWLFDDLINMYNNTSLVHDMHMKLKSRIIEFESEFTDEFDVTSEAYIEKRDERNFLKNLKNIDAWFDHNIVPLLEKVGGGMTRKVYNDKNEVVYEDLQAKDIKGLVNVLSDLSTNTYVNRVLFGHSDFDFDEHMRKGGILLVNTAKGDLVEMSSIIGKVVLIKLQSATFRRQPDLVPYHHIYVDEAPEYLYQSFKSFPAQCRKYKVMITTLQQTIAQLSGAFGEPYMDTLIGTMRNRYVFGDLPVYDAEYFSKLFGDKFEFEESETEQSVSPLQDNPMSRSGYGYSKVDKSNMSVSEMVYQDAFTFAAKIVVENKPIPVQQIKANFVPKEEFEVAKYLVADEAAEFYLAYNENDADLAIQALEEVDTAIEPAPIIESVPPVSVLEDTRDFATQVERIEKDVVVMPNTQTIKYTAREAEVIDFTAYKSISEMNKKLQAPQEELTLSVSESEEVNKQQSNTIEQVEVAAVQDKEGDQIKVNVAIAEFENTVIQQKNIDFVNQLQKDVSSELEVIKKEKRGADLFKRK